MKQIEFFEDNSLFINQNLCTYYRVIWSKVKHFHSLNKISSFYVLGGTVKSKSVKNNLLLSITKGFRKYFPDVNLAPPSDRWQILENKFKI